MTQNSPCIWHLIAFVFAATEYHLGLLKAKLARYRAQLIEPTSKSGAKVCKELLVLENRVH